MTNVIKPPFNPLTFSQWKMRVQERLRYLEHLHEDNQMELLDWDLLYEEYVKKGFSDVITDVSLE